MRRTVVLVSIVAAALVGVGGAAAIASAMAADATGHVVDVEPLWGDSPAAPVETPTPTPTTTPSRSGSSPVSVPPHESEDVGDDHGGSSGNGGDDDNSGHGGGGNSGDDNSGHGGGDDD